MPRAYSVEFEAQTVATASGDYDLFEFTPADDKPIELVGLVLAVTSELGDAAEEWLRLRVIRGHATTGNGTATTPRPLDEGDGAAGFSAETVGSTIASAGTAINLHSDGFNVRAGYQFWWPDGFGPRCLQTSTLLVVRLMAATLDDVTMSGTAYIREG
jgi:hypothetical protein